MLDEDWIAGVSADLPTTAAAHPEEMKGTVMLSLGKLISVTATGRATPAGLLSAALLMMAVLIPITRAFRRRR